MNTRTGWTLAILTMGTGTSVGIGQGLPNRNLGTGTRGGSDSVSCEVLGVLAWMHNKQFLEHNKQRPFLDKLA